MEDWFKVSSSSKIAAVIPLRLISSLPAFAVLR